MLDLAIDFATEQFSGPQAEISGPDHLYVPTTQIRIEPGGEWHRRSAIATETACGIEYGAAAYREYELSGDLCRDCFTKRERFLALNPDEIGEGNPK